MMVNIYTKKIKLFENALNILEHSDNGIDI